MRFSLLVAFVLGCASLTPVWAQNAADPDAILDPSDAPSEFVPAFAEAAVGRALFFAGDIPAALAILQPMAEAGNPVAQNLVGLDLTDPNRQIGSYNPAAGIAYLTAAATQGFTPAMLNLGVVYQENHEGIAPDPAAAYQWYRAAADLGYAPAFVPTGAALIGANGVEEDIAGGRAWLERALDGEDRGEALQRLGDLAFNGQGQEVDRALALDLYLQGAAAGDPYAALYAAYQYMDGDGTEADLAAALPLLEQAAAEDLDDAMAHLALILAYDDSDGIPTDPERAFALAQRADAIGNGFASALLGQFHQTGVGTESNFDLARAAFERGQALGDHQAIYALGHMAYFGRGMPVDYPLAYALYQAAIAIQPGHALALYSMAYMEMRGEGTSVDIVLATSRLVSLVAQRNNYAMLEAVELFGSPTYAGPQTDPVRALSHCLFLDREGWPASEEGNTTDHRATCDRLTQDLPPEDQARAASLAAAL